MTGFDTLIEIGRLPSFASERYREDGAQSKQPPSRTVSDLQELPLTGKLEDWARSMPARILLDRKLDHHAAERPSRLEKPDLFGTGSERLDYYADSMPSASPRPDPNPPAKIWAIPQGVITRLVWGQRSGPQCASSKRGARWQRKI
jgi:hypothetical protein